MKTTLSLIFMVFYLNFLTCCYGDDNKALILNLKPNATPSLISISEKGSLRVKCNTWVTACPASAENEEDFNKTYSLYDAALFVKNRPSDVDNCTDIRKAKCKAPYKTSMAWFKETETIEFGYEVYVDNSVYKNFKPSVYENYEPLKQFPKPNSPVFMDTLKSINGEKWKGGKKAELKLRHKIMDFIWIPLIRVWFDGWNQLKKIEYQILKNNVSSILKCEGYSMGEELITNAFINKLYSRKSQEMTLSDYKLTSSILKRLGCEHYECFTKWLLLPSDQFQFETVASSKCSNLVTVPIWTSTVKGILQKVDMFLYTLSRVSGEPLRIVAGVKGKLSLPKQANIVDKFPMYLYYEDKYVSIPVPKIIYKIVKIQTNKCPAGHKGNTCWYGVLIVIHNDPFYDVKKPICESVSENWGWLEIQFETYDRVASEKPPSSPFIYTCKITGQSMSSVGLTYSRNKMPIYDLKLNRFLEYKEDGNDPIDMEKKVNDELEQISKSRGKIKINKIKIGVVERPSIHDDLFTVESDLDDVEEISLEHKRDLEAQPSTSGLKD